MLNLVGIVFNEFFASLVRKLTGRLYTEEQIKSVTSGALGKYFTDFFPTPKDELEAQERVGAAQQHITDAGLILRDMQLDLEEKGRRLDETLQDLEKKKALAVRYQTISEASRVISQAFRDEMEEAIKKELQEQADNGRRIRQFVSLISGIITLIVGAAVGAYFKDIVAWIQTAV